MTSRALPRLIPLTLVVLALAVGRPEAAEPLQAGVVAALDGSATVVRVATGTPAPLRFRDPVFVHDRISTGDRSIARILLGGRGLVTVRERSEVVITSGPGTTTIDVARGRLALAVLKGSLAPGEVVQIRTPQAVAAVRGTVVVAEVTDVTVFTVLRGLVAVVALDAGGRPLGPETSLGALQRLTVGGPTPPRPQGLAPEAARRLADEYRMSPRDAAPAVSAAVSALHAPAALDAAAQALGTRRASAGATPAIPPAARERASRAAGSAAVSDGGPAGGTGPAGAALSTGGTAGGGALSTAGGVAGSLTTSVTGAPPATAPALGGALPGAGPARPLTLPTAPSGLTASPSQTIRALTAPLDTLSTTSSGPLK